MMHISSYRMLSSLRISSESGHYCGTQECFAWAAGDDRNKQENKNMKTENNRNKVVILDLSPIGTPRSLRDGRCTARRYHHVK